MIFPDEEECHGMENQAKQKRIEVGFSFLERFFLTV